MEEKAAKSKVSFLGQLDDFDQDAISGHAMNSGQQNDIINDGTINREFALNNSGSFSTAFENTVNIQTLDRYFNEMIDREIGNNVDTVEVSTQNAILTAIYDNNIPRFE